MRIVITRSNPISPDSRVEKEADALNKAGHTVMILGWDRSKKYKVKKETIKVPSGDIDIYRIGIPAGFGDGIKKNLLPVIKIQLKFMFWLFRHSKEYDAIHACDFDNAFTGIICAKALKKKLVYDIFDYYIASHDLPSKLSIIIKKIDKEIINSADSVIICSEQRKEQIQDTNPKLLEIIHNSPSKEQMNAGNTKFMLKTNKRVTRIAYVGILSRARLIKELIDCVANRSDCELHIGGFGQLEEYVKNSLKKHENIIFYGKIPYHETLQLESQCDIMTAIYDPDITNHQYAAPNKFYEALFLGKPIIMVENTGMDKVVKENDIGEIIFYTQESLDSAISNLITRKNEWNVISEKMKTLYNEKYSWEIMEKRD